MRRTLSGEIGCHLRSNTLNQGVMLLLMTLIACRLPAKADEPMELSPEQRAQHLDRMRTMARSIKVGEEIGGKTALAQLVEEPVLRYTDTTRRQFDSTMWVWTISGRPSAMMAVEYYPERPKEPKWLFEIASLSTNRITAERASDLKWKAREPGLRLQRLTEAPSPAEKPASRLVQMKQLLARFGANERAGVEGRIELRPMSRPIYRYQDEAGGVIDGAIFAFANGTNPEVLVIIEARTGSDSGEKNWQFGLTQMTGGEVFVQLDGKEIWKQGEADPPAERDAYVNGWLPLIDDRK